MTGDQALGGGEGDLASGGGAACETDLVWILLDQRRAQIAPAVHDLEDVLRETRLAQGARQQLADLRAVLRGLEDDRVARQEGGGDGRDGQNQREIPWRDDQDDAVGLAHRPMLMMRIERHEVMLGGEGARRDRPIVSDQLDGSQEFGQRLEGRSALLRHHHADDAVEVAAQALLPQAQGFKARGQAGLEPACLGGARPRHDRRRLAQRRDGHLAQLAPRGGTDRDDHLIGLPVQVDGR